MSFHALVSSPDEGRLIQPLVLLLQRADLWQHQRIARVYERSDGLPLVTRQLLHGACFGGDLVWLLADRPRQAVPASSFVVVSSLVLAGHWAVVSLDDGLV